MAIGADSDFDGLYDPDSGFGVEVIFDSSITVNGIFTGATDETTTFGVAIEAQQPTVMCKTAEITEVRPKMTCEIAGTTYKVERIERTGTGDSVVYLKT